MPVDPFTTNKQMVREMNLRLIERHFARRQGELRYLGLPSSYLTDILQWQAYFAHFSTVERGRTGEEHRYQHNLLLTAFQHGIANRLSLLRGDIDDVLISGSDGFGNPVQWPFDVVSLDYSGGILYKDSSGRAKRAEAIGSLLQKQSEYNHDFLLFVSCNLDNEDRGEIRSVFKDIGQELSKYAVDAKAAVQACLRHPQDEARLKVYVPYLVSRLAAKWYQLEHYKPIFYEGNKGTHMMNFSAHLRRTRDFAAGRPSRQTLVHILNLSAFHSVDGSLSETDFGIPKVIVGDHSGNEDGNSE